MSTMYIYIYIYTYIYIYSSYGNRAAFFVAANAATFAKKSSYTNISLEDCAGVLGGPRVQFNISREYDRESYKGFVAPIPYV